MSSKLELRKRRSCRFRFRLKRASHDFTEVPRLCVHRTSNHIYAQVIGEKGVVLASASTLDSLFKEKFSYGGYVSAALELGKQIAIKAIHAGVKKVVFDRSGFKYHGRVKALADGARESGLDF